MTAQAGAPAPAEILQPGELALSLEHIKTKSLLRGISGSKIVVS